MSQAAGRILYIERHQVPPSMWQRALRRSPVAGRVVHVAGGRQADRWLNADAFGLILIGPELADGSGLAWLRRRDNLRNKVPIIFLSGPGDEGLAAAARRSGARVITLQAGADIDRLLRLLARDAWFPLTAREPE